MVGTGWVAMGCSGVGVSGMRARWGGVEWDWG